MKIEIDWEGVKAIAAAVAGAVVLFWVLWLLVK
jgi:hypothetical protein